MDERSKEEAIAKAQLGGDIREFLKGPGFAAIERFVSDKVKNGHKEWLKSSDPAVREVLWQKAQAFAEFENFLKRLMIEGDHAAETLHKLANPSSDEF